MEYLKILYFLKLFSLTVNVYIKISVALVVVKKNISKNNSIFFLFRYIIKFIKLIIILHYHRTRCYE